MNPDFATIWEKLEAHSQLPDWSIHGPTHWKNVERFGLELARATGADETVVRLFAVFHDAQRRSESHDPEHGQRAARLALDLHGELFSIEPRQLKLLCDACAEHHLGYTSDDDTIGTCWDADRLDLPRVGMQPDPKYMSTAAGKRRARGESFS